MVRTTWLNIRSLLAMWTKYVVLILLSIAASNSSLSLTLEVFLFRQITRLGPENRLCIRHKLMAVCYQFLDPKAHVNTRNLSPNDLPLIQAYLII